MDKSLMKGHLALVGVWALTVATWAISAPGTEVTFLTSAAQLFGALGLTGISTLLFISTRNRLVDWLFHGIDKAYVGHKMTGIMSIVFLIAHVVTFNTRHGFQRGAPREFVWTHLGAPALALFVILILFALLTRKIKYESWKRVHALMFIPFVVGVVHYYGSSTFGAFTFAPLSVWMDVMVLIGLISAVYTLVFYPLHGFRYKLEVVGVARPAKDSLEITAVTHGRKLQVRPGQFAFIKFPSRKIGSHPFTISGTDGDRIQFTIKALGDHTRRLVDSVAVGDWFTAAGPYGRFDYSMGTQNQIWIAGGIGITPFRAFLKAGVPASFSIDLFYAFAEGDQAAYRDELVKLAPQNVRVHLMDDSVDGFMTAEKIQTLAQVDPGMDVFFCGPTVMRRALTKGLAPVGIPRSAIHYEQFSFRG
ncbi:MAG: ferric reductase-like transmembrane domain-containing protein [Propionibacteriaceae bacterium]|nr:ferric reductase-like transmembrane domain-containing protein [Propionibacteriaceae bacterium]